MIALPTATPVDLASKRAPLQRLVKARQAVGFEHPDRYAIKKLLPD
jgi:hypothetical protein